MARDLRYELRSLKNLRHAWDKVSLACGRSRSTEVRERAEEFSRNAESRLKKIQRQLQPQNGSFRFEVETAYAKSRGPGKKPRPIVVGTIETRIVQRALLEVVQNQGAVEALLLNAVSYGGLRGRSVRRAFDRIGEARKLRQRISIRSDIPNFFTRIRRREALDTLKGLLPDRSLDILLDEATHVDLRSVESLTDADLRLFPDEDVGVAQGCCLSPLLGNIALASVDHAMASIDGVTFVRYIDDVLILSKSLHVARRAFEHLVENLANIGLDVYTDSTSGKYKEGSRGKFEFLGCAVVGGLVQPTQSKRREFRASVQEDLRKSIHAIRHNPQNAVRRDRLSLRSTLVRVSSRVEGFSQAYRFCNSNQWRIADDRKIQEMIRAYVLDASSALEASADSTDWMDRLGVARLS